eukprot:SAG31_NODE_4994_length_2813_cov_1.546593_1_plen_134_part_00
MGKRYYLVKWLGYDGDPMEESTWETAEDLAETAANALDDFWTAHPELDRGRPREVLGEFRCRWCCEPKPKVRPQTKAEKAAGASWLACRFDPFACWHSRRQRNCGGVSVRGGLGVRFGLWYARSDCGVMCDWL